MNREFYIRVRGSDEYYPGRVRSIYCTGRDGLNRNSVENIYHGSFCSISGKLIKKLKVK